MRFACGFGLVADRQHVQARAAPAGHGPVDRVARAQADPSDIDAQLGAADVQLAGGDPAGAFARLIELVRTTSGDDRDRVRVRLLELFDTVGNSDPSVPKARRDLMTALF